MARTDTWRKYHLDAGELRNYRRVLDMTAADLAKQLGVSVATIHAWEGERYAIPTYAGMALELLRRERLAPLARTSYGGDI